MRPRPRSRIVVLALLLWQLGGGSSQAVAAPSTVTGEPGEPAHHCHESHSPTASVALNRAAGEGVAADNAHTSARSGPSPGKPPCCGSEGCKCQGASAGLALGYSPPGSLPAQIPAPSSALDSGHPSRGPSNPFRPPID